MLDADSPDLPCPDPLPEAVAAGVFGKTTGGPVEPDEQEVRSMMAEQARELAAYLAEINWLTICAEHGWKPRTGRPPRGSDTLPALLDDIDKTLRQTRQSYANCLAAYEEGFGEPAARELDRYVKELVTPQVAHTILRQGRLF